LSSPIGTSFRFVPWVRRGASSAIVQEENVTHTDLPIRATFSLETTVNGANPATVAVQLYGPKDVIGFDQLQVVRTDPKPHKEDFEPNFLASVDFDLPDFAWLMTPANPKSGAKLRPWICLVVVPLTADVKLEPASPLPVLSIGSHAGKELPDLAESWAWAHAQVTGEFAGTETLESVLAAGGDRTVSRLVCPRRLEPDTPYLACVVPTTKGGVQAGLGHEVTATTLEPAWTAADDKLDLPVYFSWDFATALSGDFESLARLLRPAEPPPGTGRQDMDVSGAGIGVPLTPDASGSTLQFEGALESPNAAPGAWPNPPRGPFQTRLVELLDAPATRSAQDPSKPGVVAPPLYGGFHAARVTVPTGSPFWLRELNVDPRYRAAAGLGTQVVQEQQEQLMAAAWQQVGEIDKANDLLRKAQLARATGAKLHERHLRPLGAGAALQLTAPAHSRLLMSPRTLEAQVRESALPSAALTTTFRRIVRPAGPVVRRIASAPIPRIRPFVSRLNGGEIAAARPRRAPDGTVELDHVGDSLLPDWLRPLRAWLRWLFPVLIAIAILLAVAALVLGLTVSWVVAAVFFGLAAVVMAGGAWLRKRLESWLQMSSVNTTSLSAESIEAVAQRPAWQPLAPGVRTLPPESAATGADTAGAARFRQAAAAKQQELRQVADTPSEEARAALQLSQVRTTLLARLDPSVTVPAAVLGRLTLPEAWEPDDPIATIMAAPSFDTPMYEPLRDLWKAALLPGVDAVEANTVTLLQTNPRFIEAYMVGLNHEMSRELLWREYPTDQRGSYFRQFWDPRGHVPAPTTEDEREALRDIPPIHTWSGRNHLGGNASHGQRAPLVLLICGDLLNRYPDAVIYATKADRRPNVKGRVPLDPPVERYPLFRGTFPPNITFVGFDLTAEEVKGGPAPRGGDPDPGPGWFFVVQEQPTEPRFGFDEHGPAAPTAWTDLSWHSVTVKDDHVSLADTKAALAAVNSPLAASWGSDAGAVAVQTIQTPFRVALSGDDMI
jgi:hypothetical protein